MSFGVIILSQSIETEQNCVIRIPTALLFILKLKIFYKDIANDVEKWFDTSSYEEDDKRLCPIGMNKKVIGLFKDELAGTIVKVFVGVRAKTWAYLLDNDDNDDDDDDDDDVYKNKKAKGITKCVIKRGLMVKNYRLFF